MQFSDTTNKLGIIQACERYCNLGDAGISGDSELIKEFTAHINEVNRRIWHTIFMAYGGWQYDDSNQTDLPAASTNLVANQTSYAMPSGALTVRGIEVLNSSADTWFKLNPINEEQIRDRMAMGEFFKTASTPLFYQMIGDSIRLFPASNYNATNGFKVFFDRGSVAFASTDTTKTPGFASEYHGVLPIGASLEYLKIKRPTDATTGLLLADYEAFAGDEITGRRGIIERKGSIEKYYSKRFSQMFPPRLTIQDAARFSM